MVFINSIKSEWLKTRRSAASWICIIAGLFIPIIYLIVFFVKNYTINSYSSSNVNCWEKHFSSLWHNSAIFLLPMTVIFSSSLITQLENKNNTWKQVHSSPLSFISVFFSKYIAIIIMILYFFIIFNLGIILSGIIPSLILDGKFPINNLSFSFLFKENTKFFITCLPIISIQYFLSLQFKNFLVSIGIGFLGLVSSLIGISWKYIFFSPYSYCTLSVIPTKHNYNEFVYAFIYFLIITIVSFIIYLKKKDKA